MTTTEKIKYNREQSQKIEFSFLLVKPSAVKTGLTGIIRQELIETGFDIVAEGESRINRFGAEVFYHDTKGPKDDVIAHITSGPSYVFMVYGYGVIKKLRELQGCVARNNKDPTGLRGKYSFDDIQNTVHCPDSHQEFVRAINNVFSTLKEKTLQTQLADKLFEFINNQEEIKNGRRYLNSYTT